MKREKTFPFKLNLQQFAEGKDGAQGESEIASIIEKSITAANAKSAETIETAAAEAVKKSLEGFGLGEDKKQDVKSFFGKKENLDPKTIEVKQPKLELEKGHAFARFCKLAFQAKHDNDMGLSQEEFIAQRAVEKYGRDTNFCKMVSFMTGKSLAKAAEKLSVKSFGQKFSDFQNVTNPQDGGYLVEEMYGEIVELLRARTFLYQMGAQVVPMPNGNLNLPVHTAGALSYFIGEGKPVFAKKQTVGNIKLSAKKQVSMVIVSDELMMNNSYQADQKFLEDILREMEVTMNYTALYGSGGEFTPKGIKNYTGVIKTSQTTLPDSTMLPELKGQLMATNVEQRNLGWVFNGALWSPIYTVETGAGNPLYQNEMNQGKLLGDKFEMFNEVPIAADAKKTTDLFYGDWNELVIGEQSMFKVDTSKDATIEDASGNTVNLFQQGFTAIKVTSFYDFALKHPEGFKVFTTVHTIA